MPYKCTIDVEITDQFQSQHHGRWAERNTVQCRLIPKLLQVCACSHTERKPRGANPDCSQSLENANLFGKYLLQVLIIPKILTGEHLGVNHCYSYAELLETCTRPQSQSRTSNMR